MALFRATWLFEDSAGYGWTETIHSLAGTLQEVLDEADTLAGERKRMMGSNVRMTGIRVSDDEVRGDSLIMQYAGNAQENTTGHDAGSDIANTCILLRITGTSNLVRRSLYLRGQEDGVVTFGAYTPVPNFVAAFDRWRRRVLADSWALKQKNPLNVPKAILGFVQTPTTGVTTVTTTVDHGFAVNDVITITGMRGATQLNGTWKIVAVLSPTSFQLQVNQLLAVATGYGNVRKVGYTLVPINDVIIRRAGHRIAGRPSDSPRGRRRGNSRT